MGPRLGVVFNSRGILTVKDLFDFFPRTYEDRTKVSEGVKEVQEGDKTSLQVKVLSVRKIPIQRGKRSILEVRCEDANGEPISLKWFHAPYGLDKRMLPGSEFLIRGTVKSYLGKKEIVHPEMDWSPDKESAHFGRVVPVYVEIEGISTRILRQVLWNALEKYSKDLKEDLPEALRLAHSLPGIAAAYRELHFPSEGSSEKDLAAFATPAHRRLIYEEFFKFQLVLLKHQETQSRETGKAFNRRDADEAMKDLLSGLPFQLTKDQRNSVEEILKDLTEPHPMNRLLQGDVGSGKTAVALLAAGVALSQGSQVALMVPTEILAEQHFRSVKKLFQEKIKVGLLLGKSTTKEREEIKSRLLSGEPFLLVGTHALLEDEIEFRSLDLVLIDEQHRFGVDQRSTLRQKGMLKGSIPHFLVLTATPIPRTLALTAYGELTVSTLRERPPGRKPVQTFVVKEEWRKRAIDKIREEIKKGRQVYFVYPLVNASEAEGFTEMKSAVEESKTIAEEYFPGVKVELLHGQMDPSDKEEAMGRFIRGESQVLVSTTVIEVGVDVPNASVMAIEHSERFGLSQLHQLRGRVGRGTEESFCFLFSGTLYSESIRRRLSVLEKTEDGFKIAEEDLEIRGPGEFLGTRQSGGLPFRIANLVRDRDLLIQARSDAEALIRIDPDLTQASHLNLRRYLMTSGEIQYNRFKAG